MDETDLYLDPLDQEMYDAMAAAGSDNTEDRPKLFVDGRRIDLKTETGPFIGTSARICSVNDKTLPAIATQLEVTRLGMYEVRAADLTVLSCCKGLTHFGLNWATKLADISFLTHFPDLEFLEILDAPKIATIEPIAELSKLRWLRYSGGMWNANHADALGHLAGLTKLEALTLTNLKVGDCGLRPLAALKNLRRLTLSNQFETADYAYLSVHLPNTICRALQPYQKGLNERYGDIMVTGKRKPFLKSRDPKDQERLKKYVAAFEKMQDEFRSAL